MSSTRPSPGIGRSARIRSRSWPCPRRHSWSNQAAGAGRHHRLHLAPVRARLFPHRSHRVRQGSDAAAPPRLAKPRPGDRGEDDQLCHGQSGAIRDAAAGDRKTARGREPLTSVARKARPKPSRAAPPARTVLDFIRLAVARLRKAKLAFAHGTTDPVAEAAFLVGETLGVAPTGSRGGWARR